MTTNQKSRPVEPNAQPLPPEVQVYLEGELRAVREQIVQLKQAEEMLRLQHTRDQGRLAGMRTAEELREAQLCQNLGLPLPRPVQPLVRAEPMQ
jgi:hypothetical protein